MGLSLVLFAVVSCRIVQSVFVVLVVVSPGYVCTSRRRPPAHTGQLQVLVFYSSSPIKVIISEACFCRSASASLPGVIYWSQSCKCVL